MSYMAVIIWNPTLSSDKSFICGCFSLNDQAQFLSFWNFLSPLLPLNYCLIWQTESHFEIY